MKTILIVDDEQAVTLAIELVLSDVFTTLKAGTGEEALLTIESKRPDALVLDVMMPGIGGLETLKILRQHHSTANLPVLLMSGVQPLARKSEYKWNDFIQKPFSATQLIKKLSDLVKD